MLTIENYGRRWRREKIAWGAGNSKGHLCGTLRRSKSTVVDFRDQIGIYVLFDPGGNVVYVGQAGMGKNKRLFGRLKDHRSDHLRDRWTHFSWFGLRGYNEKSKNEVKPLAGYHKTTTAIRKKKRSDALHEVEAVLMSVVEPPLNKRGPNWMGSKEFLQYVDSTMPQSPDEIVHELPKKLAALTKQLDAIRQKVDTW